VEAISPTSKPTEQMKGKKGLERIGGRKEVGGEERRGKSE